MEMMAMHYFLFADPSEVPRFINHWMPARQTLDTAISLHGGTYYDFTKVYKNPDIMAAVAQYNDYPSYVSCGYSGWNGFVMQILIDAKRGDPYPYTGRILYIGSDMFGDRYKNSDIHISEGTTSGSYWYTIRRGGPPEQFLESCHVGTIRE